jgi:hypothetical protein
VIIVSIATRGWTAESTARPTLPAPVYDAPQVAAVRLAIEDLLTSFGAEYPEGARFLRQLRDLEPGVAAGEPGALAALRQLRRAALLANPLLDFERLVVLQRKRGPMKTSNSPQVGLLRVWWHWHVPHTCLGAVM